MVGGGISVPLPSPPHGLPPPPEVLKALNLGVWGKAPGMAVVESILHSPPTLPPYDLSCAYRTHLGAYTAAQA
jgi:hypothetical protein